VHHSLTPNLVSTGPAILLYWCCTPTCIVFAMCVYHRKRKARDARQGEAAASWQTRSTALVKERVATFQAAGAADVGSSALGDEGVLHELLRYARPLNNLSCTHTPQSSTYASEVDAASCTADTHLFFQSCLNATTSSRCIILTGLCAHPLGLKTVLCAGAAVYRLQSCLPSFVMCSSQAARPPPALRP
jgi:hypothetical protein